jgi:hypothetical protein
MRNSLEGEVHRLMAKGIYEPEELFKRIYHKYPVHYSKVREAIHAAKQ